jgi:hypothetical protein
MSDNMDKKIPDWSDFAMAATLNTMRQPGDVKVKR